jgi:diadenosine tetraphosphate (Ap4A) HIT family hydrolase
MAFSIHPRLAADTVPVTSLGLSSVRLMNDRLWPWLVLVPEREGLVELIDLGPEERQLLIEEIALASSVLRVLFQPDKLNVAALGNQVSQLHVHVIARRRQDPAWPRPVWGVQAPVAYGVHDRDKLVAALQDAFSAHRDSVAALREAAAARDDGGGGFLSLLGFTDR